MTEACLDQLQFAAGELEREANSISDNPLVFPDTGEIHSGGNFHAEPVAMATDNIALTIAEIRSIPERRQAMIVGAPVSGLPAFLASDSGLNSGFMMVQVTSANQEDHVSMATYAARRLTDMAENCRMVIAIEWMPAAQEIKEWYKRKPELFRKMPYYVTGCDN